MLPKYNIINLKNAKEAAIELHINLPKSEKQLDEAFAFANIVELVLNVEAGFGHIPQSILKMPNLKTLHIENLKKLKTAVEIPEVLLELPQIEYLKIFDCQNLAFGSKSWEKMLSLNTLYISRTGEEFPIGLPQAPNLKKITLSSAAYKKIPAHFADLKNLEYLHLDIFYVTPSNVLSKLPNLKELRMYCNEVPQWIGDCNKQIKNIFVYARTEAQGLPESVFEYTELEELEICNAGLLSLSPKIKQLKTLKKLRLSRNKLSELPQELLELEKLERLDIEYNKFATIPGILILPSSLNELNIKGTTTHDSEITRFEKFIAWIKANSFDMAEKAFLADVWDKKEMSADLLNADLLFKALKSGIVPLDVHAIYYLTEQSERAYKALKAGDSVFVAAKTNIKKTVLKEKLSALNIQIAKSDAEPFTHIVIDEKINQLPPTGFLMSELQLQNYLDNEKPDYLLETVQANPESVDNVNQLLLGLDDANIEIAFSLLKSGGIPKESLTALFLVYKLSDNKALCSKALKLIQTVASHELSSALKKRVDFKKMNSFYDFNSAMSVFENTELDLGLFAVAYTQKKQKDHAMQYVLNLKNEAYTKEFLLLISADGTLNLSLSYYKIDYVPECLYTFEHLKKLRLVVDTEMGKNSLKSIEKLTNLEELELDDSLHKIGMFAMPFLESLTKLTKLKSIRVYGMSAETKAFLETHLPSCSLRS